MNLTKAYSFHSAREPRITYQSKIENDLPQLNHCSNWMFVLKNIFTILLLEFDKIKCFFLSQNVDWQLMLIQKQK